MGDGAHGGWTADTSLRGSLGGGQPKDPGMTPEEMRQYLMSCPSDPQSYDDVSRYAGKKILNLLDTDQAAKTLDAFALFDAAFPVDRDREDNDPIDGITGFMVGWACNAARYASGAPPIPNPALITLHYQGAPVDEDPVPETPLQGKAEDDHDE